MTNIKKEEISIKPYWTSDKWPHFYQLTKTQYCRLPYVELFQNRGIFNPVLNSLVGFLPPGAFIAGGFITSILRGGDQQPGDIDIFFSGGEAFAQTYELFLNPPQDPKAWAFREYEPSLSMDKIVKDGGNIKLVKMKPLNQAKLPVQLIKMVWYDNAEHVIDSFDFTVCQFCIDGEYLVFNPVAMMDLFKNCLVSHRHQYPADSLYRLIKYTKKGFQASPMALIKLANEIRNSTEMDPPVLNKFY
jgi:hypothetical protein